LNLVNDSLLSHF